MIKIWKNDKTTNFQKDDCLDLLSSYYMFLLHARSVRNDRSIDPGKGII